LTSDQSLVVGGVSVVEGVGGVEFPEADGGLPRDRGRLLRGCGVAVLVGMRIVDPAVLLTAFA
jgi:hypothetical protein